MMALFPLTKGTMLKVDVKYVNENSASGFLPVESWAHWSEAAL